MHNLDGGWKVAIISVGCSCSVYTQFIQHKILSHVKRSPDFGHRFRDVCR